MAVARVRRHAISPLARTLYQDSGKGADEGRHEEGPRGEELARGRGKNGAFVLEHIFPQIIVLRDSAVGLISNPADRSD